jgi:hypothetical protein
MVLVASGSSGHVVGRASYCGVYCGVYYGVYGVQLRRLLRRRGHEGHRRNPTNATLTEDHDLSVIRA